MDEKNDDSAKKDPFFSIRLFSGSEDQFTVRRPSAGAFKAVRKIALQSADVPLARKFEICTELCLDWREHIELENAEKLETILKNMAHPDPAALGEKVLDGHDITERHTDKTLSVIDAQIAIARLILANEKGLPPKINEENREQVLPGNIRKASTEWFSMINIGSDEDLSTRTSFRPFAEHDEQYPLEEPSVRTMMDLAELQLATPSIPRSDRKTLAAEMKMPFTDPDHESGVSKPEYWIRAAEIILTGVKPSQGDRELIDAGEMNRALTVFFSRSEGLL